MVLEVGTGKRLGGGGRKPDKRESLVCSVQVLLKQGTVQWDGRLMTCTQFLPCSKCVFSSVWFSKLHFFSLAYFIARILYIIHMTCKICVNHNVFMFWSTDGY